MRWFRKSNERPNGDGPEVEPGPCPHVERAPQWDDANDMGREDLASSFTCTSCGAVFTPDEERTLRATEAARVRALTRP